MIEQLAFVILRFFFYNSLTFKGNSDKILIRKGDMVDSKSY